MALAYINKGPVARRNTTFSPTANIVIPPTGMKDGNSQVLHLWGMVAATTVDEHGDPVITAVGPYSTDDQFQFAELGYWTTIFDVRSTQDPVTGLYLRQAAYFVTHSGALPSPWHITTGGAFANRTTGPGGGIRGSEWNGVIYQVGTSGATPGAAVVGDAGAAAASVSMIRDSSNGNLPTPPLTNMVPALAGAFACRYSSPTASPTFASSGPDSPGGHGFVVRSTSAGGFVNATFATKDVPATGVAVTFPTWANASSSAAVMLAATSSFLSDTPWVPVLAGGLTHGITWATAGLH